MSIELSPDQIEFRDTLRSFLSEKVSSEYRRRRIESDSPSDPVLWRELCELGLVDGFTASDSTFGFRELAIVAAEFGRVLLPESFLEHLFAGAWGYSLTKSKLSSKVDGETRYTSTSKEGITGEISPRSGKFSGELRFVNGGKTSQVCLAQFANDSWSYLELGTEVSWIQQTGLDLTAKLGSVTVENIGAVSIPQKKSKILSDAWATLTAACIAGALESVLELTVQHAITREQFGKPIGSFQAVQHMMADMKLHHEALGALVDFAAWSIDSSPEQQTLSSKSALLYGCEWGPAVIEKAIQVHGGIGFTWEYDLHLYLRYVRRLVALSSKDQGTWDSVLDCVRN